MLLHLLWFRRARQLAHALKAMGEGDLSQRTGLGGRDELALIGQAADRMAGQPKLARQVNFDRFERAHKALTQYLRPLGQGARLQGGAVSIAASVLLGLMVLGAAVVWIMLQRGLI